MSLRSVSPRKNAGSTGAHDQHEHHTEQDHPETQDQDQTDAADARAAAVIRRGAVAKRDQEDPEQTEPAQQREQQLEHEALEVCEEFVAEVPDAGERGQAVIEADHDAERVDGVGEHVLAGEGEDRVEQRRADAGRDQRVGRGQVAGVNPGEALREGLVGPHRQHGPRGRQECGDQAGGAGGHHGKEQEQVERAAHHGFGEGAEDVVGDLLISQTQPLGSDSGVHLGRDGDQQIGAAGSTGRTAAQHGRGSFRSPWTPR